MESYLIIFAGFIIRLGLAYALPIWHDEAYSIWASTTPLSNIIHGITDPVHTPGYYLFLKLWSLFSLHLFWLRLSSLIFYLFNALLLYKLAQNISRRLPIFVLFLYAFSGYFLIFDWQVRMYTLVLTAILLSLILYQKAKIHYTYLITFTLINTVGLYIDYGFFWYFFPLTLLLCIKTLLHFRQYRTLFLSTLISAVLFIGCFPDAFTYYFRGVESIQWMAQYMSPDFVIPYFFGTHILYPALPFLILLFVYGIYILWTQYRRNPMLQLLTFTAIFSLAASLLYSLSGQIVFHVRSLQIVALYILIISALALHWLYTKHKYIIFAGLLLVVITNCYFVTNIIIHQPRRVLVSPFPWKNIINAIPVSQVNYVAYRQTHELPTPLLLWGLQYTLNGNESLFSKKIPMMDITNTNDSVDSCLLISQSLMDIYACK